MHSLMAGATKTKICMNIIAIIIELLAHSFIRFGWMIKIISKLSISNYKRYEHKKNQTGKSMETPKGEEEEEEEALSQKIY